MGNQDTCTLPSHGGDHEHEIIQRLIRANRIAVVGLSDDPGRPSFGVASYLLSVGKEIVPVNPKCQEVFGLKCYASLEEIPGEIDLVDVFRRPEFCPQIVREAAQIHAKAVWLQSGIRSAEARKIAADSGLDFIEDRCLMVEHMHGK